MFKPVSLTGVAKLILSSLNKSCKPIPIPTFLLTSCLHTIIVPINQIINGSVSSGVFPSHYKHARVNSFLKKPSLQTNDLNSCRPSSNLSFLSKVLRQILSRRLNVYLNSNHLYNDLQSAYKQFHSTETALLKVHSDISLNMDRGHVTALTLLDLTATFDTIDNSVLLDRLSGTSLTWIRLFSIIGMSRQRSKLNRFLPTRILNHSITSSYTT